MTERRARNYLGTPLPSLQHRARTLEKIRQLNIEEVSSVALVLLGSELTY
ncbi:unnamed protein product [Amoebophrya sp. A25]|nr:unnamed protein product [Amoebophrya sp. A25]|eukprot:GSA25T00024934001.1